MKSFTFSDGYTVVIDDRATLTVKTKGKIETMHCSHFKDVPPGSRAEEAIRQAGKDSKDYLFANPSGREVIVRATEGVREAVAEAAQASAKERKLVEEQHLRARQDLRRACLSACQLEDPVDTVVDLFDGYPSGVVIDGKKMRNVDWAKVSVGQCSFIERGEESRLMEAYEKEKEATQRAVEAKVLSAVSLRNEKLLEAQASGKPVVLSSRMTQECRNGNGSECSFDQATELIHPDGSISTSYACCY